MNAQTKFRIQLVQLNSFYGKKVYLPYSVGMLRAYCEEYEEIRKNFEFLPFLYRRDSINSIVNRIGQVDILAVSCYIWNWRLSIAIAEEVHRRNPECLIILGGPHVPNEPGDFFERYPFVDIVCHGEGEITFHEILQEYLRAKRFDKIKGLSLHERRTGQVVQTPQRKAIRNLDILPSPYLSGTFSELLDIGSEDIEWMVSLETNRGCPFTCTFCYWGKGALTKIRKFSMERIEKEIKWFADKRAIWIFSCDANFGILPRDLEITQMLAKVKKETGYPLEFRVCTTKNSNERVFQIAKILYDAKMSKGVSLSLESLNDDTLKKIKRKNIDIVKFREMLAKYNNADMPTFTELIIALPGETYESFLEGIDVLLDNGQHSQLNIYNCTVLPNTEMATREYQEEHGFHIVSQPIFQGHSSPSETYESVVEYESIVVGTSTMPVTDWRRTFHFAWAVQCFHLLGLLQAVAIFLRNQCSIRYGDFYREILGYGALHPSSVVGGEISRLDKVLDNILAGVGSDQYLPQFSNITWPPEEASFLRLSERIDTFYTEFAEFLCKFLDKKGVELEGRLLTNLLVYQRALVVHYDNDGNVEIDLHYNLHEYIQQIKVGAPIPLEEGRNLYRMINTWMLAGDKQRFAREVVWFGRKGGKFLRPVERIVNRAEP